MRNKLFVSILAATLILSQGIPAQAAETAMSKNLKPTKLAVNKLASEPWNGESIEKFTAGTGMKDDPYEISTAAQLRYLSVETRKGAQGQEDQYYELTEDIDLGNQNWEPIGYAKQKQSTFYGGMYFKGTFDGNGHVIKNMKINQTNPQSEDFYYGLFGWNTGVIQNLKMENANIDSDGFSFIGGIAGANKGKISNCTFNGSIKGYNEVGDVGGIVGRQIGGSVSECRNKATIEFDRKDCNYIGGIVGYNEDGSISACINEGKVDGKNYIGGITGHNDGYHGKASIEKCMNFGEITGYCYVGGITGECFRDDDLIESINVGFTKGEQYTGGIAGAIATVGDTEAKVEGCVNIGDVKCNDYGGAITGILHAQSKNSVNVLKNCYYLESSAKKAYKFSESAEGSNDIAEIVGLDSGQIMQKENYAKLDFENTWEMAKYFPIIRGSVLDDKLLELPVKHQHTYTEWKSNKDVHWKECSCGEKDTAAKHQYNAGKLTKAPTSSKTGTMTYTCKECGKKKTTTVAKLVNTKISKLTAKTKGFTVSWKKVSSANGYQVQYATNKKFTKAKSITITGNNKTSKTVKSLKASKKYYVRIRTYKKIQGKTCYSSWTSAKAVKVKK